MADGIDLDAIKARAAAATGRPWRWAYPGSDSPELMGIAGDENYTYETEIIEVHHDGGCGCRKACDLTVNMTIGDAEFIAAARTDVPALVAEVERLRADNETKETEIVLALRMHETQFNRANRVTAERDAALARIRAVEAVVADWDEWEGPQRKPASIAVWVVAMINQLRAALAAPGFGSDV